MDEYIYLSEEASTIRGDISAQSQIIGSILFVFVCFAHFPDFLRLITYKQQ